MLRVRSHAVAAMLLGIILAPSEAYGQSAPFPHWRASTTNGEWFTDGVPMGNHAVISHHDGLDYVGYGNSWYDWLEIRLDVTALGIDPLQDATDVRVTCKWLQMVEPGYDFVHFRYARADGESELVARDGITWNMDLDQYGHDFFDSDDHGGITYTPGDYVDGTSVVLRVGVTSDGSGSDEVCCYFLTYGRGAAGLDDIEIRFNDVVVSYADWEPVSGIPLDNPDGDVSGANNGAGPGTAGWLPDSAPVAAPPDMANLFLEPNHPNPFNPTTTIAFDAPERGQLRIEVFDARGRFVAKLLDGQVDAGQGTVQWDGRDEMGQRVASGVYLYRLEGFGQTLRQKMVLIE